MLATLQKSFNHVNCREARDVTRRISCDKANEMTREWPHINRAGPGNLKSAGLRQDKQAKRMATTRQAHLYRNVQASSRKQYRPLHQL